MRVWIILSLLLSSIALADPIQAWRLTLARYYSQHGQASQARAAYEKITPKNDHIHYNLGNLLYQEQAYQEAISHYAQISTPELMHPKYHNIANCLMKLGETATAIVYYQNALKFASHPNTRFNLTLAQALLAQKAKEAKEKELRDSNETRAFRDGAHMIDRYKEDNGTADLKDAKDPTTIHKKINTSKAAQHSTGGKVEILHDAEHNVTIQEQDQASVDSYEAQRWEQYFRHRTPKTLLIPLETQGALHDQNPY